MSIDQVTIFFMWSTVFSGGLLIFSSLFIMLASEVAYSLHGPIFKISKEAFHIAVYSYLGIFKILFFTFSLVPYLALLMMN